MDYDKSKEILNNYKGNLSDNQVLINFILRNHVETEKSNDELKLHPERIVLAQESVVHLDLSGLHITRVKDTIFDDFPFIEYLHLGFNQIQFDDDFVIRLPRLRILRLNHNFIKILPDQIFHEVRNLEKLDLQMNNLVELHESNFQNILALKYLDINSNRIETFPFFLKKYAKELAFLNFTGNTLSFDFLPVAAITNFNTVLPIIETETRIHSSRNINMQMVKTNYGSWILILELLGDLTDDHLNSIFAQLNILLSKADQSVVKRYGKTLQISSPYTSQLPENIFMIARIFNRVIIKDQPELQRIMTSYHNLSGHLTFDNCPNLELSIDFETNEISRLHRLDANGLKEITINSSLSNPTILPSSRIGQFYLSNTKLNFPVHCPMAKHGYVNLYMENISIGRVSSQSFKDMKFDTLTLVKSNIPEDFFNALSRAKQIKHLRIVKCKNIILSDEIMTEASIIGTLTIEESKIDNMVKFQVINRLEGNKINIRVIPPTN